MKKDEKRGKKVEDLRVRAEGAATVKGGLQNAESVRSQAEKRLEQQRQDLTRNWGG